MERSPHIGIVNVQRGALVAEIVGETFATITDARQAGCAFVLHEHDDVLELLAGDDKPGTGVHSEFRSLDLRPHAGNCSRHQPLGRAIGKQCDFVVDATAGCGYDSVLLACMGCRVLAMERSPIVAALFANGLRRAAQHPAFAPIVAQIELRTGDAMQLLADTATTPDVIYIDPMFPPKRRASALAPKRVRILRELVGDDEDAAPLLAVSRAKAKRVVVKRPTHAPPIAENPSHTIESKLVRYDVYLSH